MSWIEEVKEILREQLKANKIRIIEPQGFEDCYLFIVEIGDDVYLIGSWRGKNSLYAKIIPATSAPTRWDCRSLEYNPVGLYVFAENPQELARNIAKKFPIIINISKKIHLALA